MTRQQAKTHHQQSRSKSQYHPAGYSQPHPPGSTFTPTLPSLSQSTFSPSHAAGHHTQVSFDLRTTHTIEEPVAGNLATLRSPSMLQLSSNQQSTSSSTQLEGQRQRHGVRANKGVSPGNRGSRIPVRSKPGARSSGDVYRGRNGGDHRTRNDTGYKSEEQGHHPRHANSNRVHFEAETQIRTQRQVRGSSPPVPALAKKLGQQSVHAYTPQVRLLPPLARSEEAATPAAVVMARQSSVVSPPVPALARKLKFALTPDKTTVAALPKFSQHASSHDTRMSQEVEPGRHSPPVPALGNRKEATHHTHPVGSDNHVYTSLPPLSGNIAEKPHPHKHQVILQELAELRKVGKACTPVVTKKVCKIGLYIIRDQGIYAL